MNVVDYLFFNSKKSDKDFLLDSANRTSYRKIYNDSIILSNWLKKTVGENKPILIISPNSAFLITAYLGIMKSGNVVIPINPSIEQSNLDYILDITDASHMFVSKRIKSNYDIEKQHVFDELDLEKTIIGGIGIVTENNLKFDDGRLAQILFTSGSTGQPKGVMLSHKNLIANTNSIIEYLQLSHEDIMEVVLPFYYCYGLSLLHTHLRVGGSIVLNNNFIFLASVLNDLKKYKCTGFAGVPSHFQILLRKSDSFKKTEFPNLRYVTQAGGKLHDVFITEFVEAFPAIHFYVMYGQTEATARLSFLPYKLILKKLGSIGKGIPGVTLELVNEKNEIVKNGEVGEIIAKGENVMIGYLNDLEGNEKTLQNGWLHTGDIAKRDEDGFLYLYARKREIIKVGGKRVSPKEIEEIIVSIQYVLSCKIKSTYDELLGEAIKACIILKDDIDPEMAKIEIYKTCKNKLAIHKIPSFFEFESKLSDPLRMSK